MDKENFIITGNAAASNNYSAGIRGGGSYKRNTGTSPLYGRVISINTTDRSITYETIKNNVGSSALHNTSKITGRALCFDPTIVRLPKVGEIVPIVKGPDNMSANSSNRYDEVAYYQSPISIQQTVDDNAIIPDKPTVINNPNSIENYNLNTIGVTTQKPPNNPDPCEGTDLDGINGFYTSQFQMPVDMWTGIQEGKTVTDVTKLKARWGESANAELLALIQSSTLTEAQLFEWNDFQKWMSGNKYSSSKLMNNKSYSKNVWSEYKKIKPNFFIKYKPDLTSDEIREVQKTLQIYRTYIIHEWEKGSRYAPGIYLKDLKNTQDALIAMNPKNPEDRQRVYNEFMRWAKPCNRNKP